ncbi:hypothetical protein HOY82DRAFT_602978 [Tuber indicum]|nr:hypothetical protein HOY82DRAFT_602978 [Tuber indicum]
MDYNYFTEGLEGANHLEYQGIDSFTTAIESQLEKLRSGNTNGYTIQYLIVTLVTQHELAKVQQIRDSYLKGLRFMYLNDTKTLIIKIMLSSVHEIVCTEFAMFLWEKVLAMKLKNDLSTIGSTTFQGKASSKEADFSFKPVSRKRRSDWPTLVFECGVTESYAHLKTVAHWWLDNSLGSVKIVLLLVVSETRKSIRLEQWENISISNSHPTKNNPSSIIIRPTKTQQVSITESTTTGPAFIFDFEKIFLRQPVNGEGNIIFTAQDLGEYARKVWLVTE